MKTMRFAKRTSITAVALAVILGLGLGATQSAQAQNFTLLHVFTGTPDGSYPLAGFVQDAAGNLYGTTQQGGISGGVCTNTAAALDGCGTAVQLDATGLETVLYRFTGGADGQSPTSGLVVDAAGNLYGTTAAAVFKLDTSATFAVLHSPGAFAGLAMDAAGNLYGTSADGIFKLDPLGAYTVLAP